MTTKASLQIRRTFTFASSLFAFVFCSAFLGMCESTDETVPVGTSETTYKYYVFVTNSTDGTVSTFSEDASTGALTLAGSPATTGSSPTSVVAHPNGKFIYVLNSGAGTTQTYSVEPSTGALSAVGSAVASGARSITIDPSGKFAYVVEYGPTPASGVYMFTIDSTTGALTATAPASVSIGAVGGFGAINLAVNPASTYAYVSNNHDNKIHVYSINSSTGVLTSSTVLDPASQNSGGASHVVGLTINASGTFMLGTNNQTPGGVDTYSINSSTGAVTWSSFLADAGSSGLGAAIPGAGSLDPSGKCYYAGGGNVSGVYAFSVNASNGALTQVAGSPYSGPSKQAIVDPQGKYVYVVGPGNAVSVYGIDSSDCSLTTASPATVSTGAGPVGIAAVKIAQ